MQICKYHTYAKLRENLVYAVCAQLRCSSASIPVQSNQLLTFCCLDRILAILAEQVDVSHAKHREQGPVVQSSVNLTTSLSQLVKCMPTTYANTPLFFCWKNVRICCNAKDSHIFSTKNYSVFVIFEIIKIGKNNRTNNQQR